MVVNDFVSVLYIKDVTAARGGNVIVVVSVTVLVLVVVSFSIIEIVEVKGGGDNVDVCDERCE